MGSIITLGFHSLKLLFKSKWLLLILFLMPLFVSAVVTCGLQMVYKPASTYLLKPHSEEQSIEFIAKKANEAGEKFKLESDLYPAIENQLAMKTELPELAANTTKHFFKLLLPAYYPKFGKIIDNAMTNLNVIIVILLTISILPAIFGVFLMNFEKKDQTITSIIAQGVSSFEYVFSKLFAGLLISVLITIASLIGYVLGAYCNATITAQKLSISIPNINQIVVLGIAGSFCAIAISILFCLIITDNKSQIIVGGFLTPILVIAIYIFAIHEPVIQDSVKDIKNQFSSVKMERIPVDKKEVSYLAERQFYDRAQMISIKIGGEIIPEAISTISIKKSNTAIDKTNCSLFSFLTIAGISIFLSLLLSVFRFRNL